MKNKIMKSRLIKSQLMKYSISVTLGLFVLLFSVVKVFLHILMNLAIGRKTVDIPKYKIARQFTRLIAEAGAAEEWMRSQEMEKLAVRSRDGCLLTGYFLAAKQPKRTLVMVHGWRSEWVRDFAAMAVKLHQKGCNLLFIEQRAHGQSEGKYIGFGVLERYDCQEWLRYLTKTKGGGLPIYLAGLSMGASTVLMAAGLELPKEVKGVIADCGFTSPYEMVAKIAGDVFHIPAAAVRRINRMCRKKAGYSLNDYTTLKAMEVCRLPVLFVHGTADSFVPIDMTLRNYAACQAKKKLLLVEGAEHGKSFIADMDGYLAAVSNFFDWDKENRVWSSWS